MNGGGGGNFCDLRFQLYLLEGDELSGELVPGLVHDAVRALADLLDLLEVLHAALALGNNCKHSSPDRPPQSGPATLGLGPAERIGVEL